MRLGVPNLHRLGVAFFVMLPCSVVWCDGVRAEGLGIVGRFADRVFMVRTNGYVE